MSCTSESIHLGECMYILLVSGLADSHPRSRRYGSCCTLLAALLWAKKKNIVLYGWCLHVQDLRSEYT